MSLSVIVLICFCTALPTGPSLVCSLALSVLTFAAMQMFSEELANSQLGTIGGGFIGSLLFFFMLTVRHIIRLSCLMYYGLYRLLAM